MEIHNKKSFDDHLNDYQTAFYLDFLLFESQPVPSEKILTHVENCPSCKDKILEMIIHMKKIQCPENKKTIPQEMLSRTMKKFQKSRKAIIKQIAASIFLFAFLLTIYFTVTKSNLIHQTNDIIPVSPTKNHKLEEKDKPLPHSETNPSKQVSPHSILTKKAKLNHQYPEFKINSNLELMINSQTRNETIKVISPSNQVVFQDEILFNWEPLNVKPIQLKILNNRNEIIFEYSIIGESFLFKEKLSPGLYYWKLENKNDLLFVGKFLINKKINSQPE